MRIYPGELLDFATSPRNTGGLVVPSPSKLLGGPKASVSIEGELPSAHTMPLEASFAHLLNGIARPIVTDPAGHDLSFCSGSWGCSASVLILHRFAGLRVEGCLASLHTMLEKHREGRCVR